MRAFASRLRLLRDLLSSPERRAYGPAASQGADLHLPDGAGSPPVCVLIHGGSWEARYGRRVMRGLAGDLTRRGWAVWNIEYRRVGRRQGGGWPATFTDVAAAVDALADASAALDLDSVVVIGHSAGGQLALWVAGRDGLPAHAPGAGPRVRIRAAVSQAGVIDLAGAHREAAGASAVAALMGGGPEQVPERYALGDPLQQVPLGVPVLLVHGPDDQTVSVRRSRDYARAARDAGASVELVEIPGGAGRHRGHLDPGGRSWKAVVAWLERLPFAPPR